MKDEPCRCIEDENTVAVVEPGVDECDHQHLKFTCCKNLTKLMSLLLVSKILVQINFHRWDFCAHYILVLSRFFL